MNFQVIFSDDLRKNLSNLKRKDKIMYNAIKKKIMQISSSDKNSIKHFKNLKSPMSDFKRVHMGSFVLIFRIEDNIILFEKFEHHDAVYEKR